MSHVIDMLPGGIQEVVLLSQYISHCMIWSWQLSCCLLASDLSVCHVATLHLPLNVQPWHGRCVCTDQPCYSQGNAKTFPLSLMTVINAYHYLIILILAKFVKVVLCSITHGKCCAAWSTYTTEGKATTSLLQLTFFYFIAAYHATFLALHKVQPQSAGCKSRFGSMPANSPLQLVSVSCGHIG